MPDSLAIGDLFCTTPRRWQCLGWGVAVFLFVAPGLARGFADDEFVGPFPSWLDVQRDFGAVGDGKADDTPALQRALDFVGRHRSGCVLYLPRGTYRLTKTLASNRANPSLYQGIQVVGENPADTVLLWDGPEHQTMLEWDAWYSKISRLTFDGAKRAGKGLLYGPHFSTYNETSDLVFRDLEKGVVLGNADTEGQAENSISRCQFLRCGIGVETRNFNSLDIWIWHCRFEDCGRGVHNFQGSWQTWNCLFLRSQQADMSAENLSVFVATNNVSLGSKRFFDFDTGHGWGSPCSITANRVVDPTGDFVFRFGNAGPFLLVDNQLRLGASTQRVKMSFGDQTLVGNRYTRSDAVVENGRFRRIGERVVAAEEISRELPQLPATPRRRERPMIEVAAGATGPVIQAAIDRAAAMGGQRPIVHLPQGTYHVNQTLVVPAGCDVQIVGDGALESATYVVWNGLADQTLLRLAGPSRATLRDLRLDGRRARALMIERADQPGGKIYTDQLNVKGPDARHVSDTAALRVDGLEQTDVMLRSLQGEGYGSSWVSVVGGPHADRAQNQISILSETTSAAAANDYEVRNGGRLLVRGTFHERGGSTKTSQSLTDRGRLTLDSARIVYRTSSTSPTFCAEDFCGQFTVVASQLLQLDTTATPWFESRGNGKQTDALALGISFWVVAPTVSGPLLWQNHSTPLAQGGLLGSNINTRDQQLAPKGYLLLEEVTPAIEQAPAPAEPGRAGTPAAVDDAVIVRHLEQLRSSRLWIPHEVPAGATDVHIHRVLASSSNDTVVEIRAQ